MRWRVAQKVIFFGGAMVGGFLGFWAVFEGGFGKSGFL
jgi:hypothetical protein